MPNDERAPAVAVVAGDGVVRRRATSALAQDGQVVLVQAASSDELEPEDARRADAVVIACRARADQRAAAIRAARMRLPEARVIVIATADANGVHKALEAGAHGFVLDVDLVATLAPTVRAVHAGQLVVPPMARASVVRPPLSHREKQTLQPPGARTDQCGDRAAALPRGEHRQVPSDLDLLEARRPLPQ